MAGWSIKFMASTYDAELQSAGYETKYGTSTISLVDRSSSAINASTVVPGTGSIIPLTDEGFWRSLKR